MSKASGLFKVLPATVAGKKTLRCYCHTCNTTVRSTVKDKKCTRCKKPLWELLAVPGNAHKIRLRTTSKTYAGEAAARQTDHRGDYFDETENAG